MDSGKVLHRRKPSVPVVRPRGPDRKPRIPETYFKSLDINKVVRLLEDPLTANLKERHLFVLKRLFKTNQNGFVLKDLTAIAKILNTCADKVKDHPDYLPLLCEALKICRLPFLKERTSDELTHARDATRFLSHIGCLMRVSDADVRQHIIECVKSFYSSVSPRQLLHEVQPTSPGYRLQLLEHSDLAQTLLLSMVAVDNHPNIRVQLLQTLQILSSSSDLNCASILRARGAEVICLHMNQPDPSGQILFHSSEILWNLLERGSKEEVTAQLSSMECVVSLKEAFLHQLLQGVRHTDLQLRNYLLVITSLVAGGSNTLYIESLFAKQLIALVTYPELKSHNPLICNLQLSFNNEDLNMKKMLLNLLVLMSKDSAVLQLCKEEHVMLVLVMLIKPPPASTEPRPGVRHWSSVQQEELQLHALAALATLAPLILDDYMGFQGNACLLLLLDWCVAQDAYSGRVDGWRGSKRPQIRLCLRVLRSVSSLGEESVNQDLCDQGAINHLLGILMQMEASPDEDDDVMLEIKSDVQLILSALCDTDMHRKELFGSEGVEMAVHFLKKGVERSCTTVGHNKLILSTVDCVWSCIVGCYTTEDYFLAKEGASVLLDLLRWGPRCVHGVVLATLLELSDNPNTLAHLLSWRDRRGHTAPGLLLQMWREEEEELRVTRDQHGGLADPRRPLLSHHQQEDLHPSPTAAVLEMLENLRSKIYSIFCKLGFQELPGLSTQDHVTLSIVRRYLDFKVGEVWDEVSKELVLDGVKPVTPDRESLETMCKITEDTAMRVLKEQMSILKHQDQEDMGEEELLYTEIKSRWKQLELTAKSWDHYVSKTSNYDVLKEVKTLRENSIESWRPKPDDDETVLHPEQGFIGQVLSVERTGAQGPAGVKVTVARVPLKTTAQDLQYFSTMSVEH